MHSITGLPDLTSGLDARYHLLRGEVERSEETTLLEAARALREAGTAYAGVDDPACEATMAARLDRL